MHSAVKLVVALVAVVLLGWAVKCGYDRSIRQQDEQSERRDSLTTNVKKTNTVFVTDTIKLRQQIAISDTIRHNLVLTDTVHVRRVLTQDSITIQACVEAESSCAATIQARDALIAELRKPIVTPRLSFYGEALYGLDRSLTAKIGPEYRLVWGFSLRAEAEVETSASGAYKGALRVGIRKTF